MKILNFAPNAYIGAHAVPEAIVLKELRRAGHEIIQITCNGIYSNYCVSMSAAGVLTDDDQSKKERVCLQCKTNKKYIAERFNINQVDLEQFVNSDDLKNAELIVDKLNLYNWCDFKVEEIPVGRYAAYEFILNNKLNSENLTVEEFNRLKKHIVDCLVTITAARRILEAHQPDRYVTYNSNYSVNNVFAAVANNKHCSAYTLHAGSHALRRLEQITITKGVRALAPLSRQTTWHEFRQRNLTKSQIQLAHEHILELSIAKSPWVYSIKARGVSTEQLFSKFGISGQKKVVLAVMSSKDEDFAGRFIGAQSTIAEKSVFYSQEVWIDKLISHMDGRKDAVLIIRPHPREFPNKRESVLSPTAVRLRSWLANTPENIKINWPEDNISLHDLLKIVDIGLHTTSTAGLEMLLFGIPVINYVHTELAYPRSLDLCAQTEAQYFDYIDTLLTTAQPSFQNICEVYKWFCYNSEVASINIGDVFKQRSDSLFSRLIRKIYKIFDSSNPFLDYKVSYDKRPKNYRWLTYAIESNQRDHFQEFINITRSDSSNLRPCDASKLQIKVLKMLKRLAINDPIYERKLKNIMRSEESYDRST